MTKDAAAAKLLQLCPTLCDPIDGSPPGSPVPGVLQKRTLEWVAISFSNAWKWKVKVKSLSCAQLLRTPWTAAYQVPPSMGFSRQEFWIGVPLPWNGNCVFSLLLEMAGWHHGLDERESEWTPGDGDGWGGLACCNSRGRKESDTTEWLNWTELNFTMLWWFLPHFDMNQLQMHVSPHPEPPSYLLPHPSLWVVPEHRLWVPCFMHRTCIGHLFYIC